MTAKVREAWELYEQGWPPRRIARELCHNVTTIRWRLNCAKQELRMRNLYAELPRCACGLLLPCDHDSLEAIGGRRNPWP